MAHIRKVLSFDVGIINLAYCLLEINDTDNTFKILSWDIINLASDNRSLCSFVKNNNKVCDKVAKCMVKLNEQNCKYYCKAHVTKAELNVQNINVTCSLINKPDPDLEKCNLCNKKGQYLINMIQGQYCERHSKTIMSNNGYLCKAKKCKNIVTKGIYLDDHEPLKVPVPETETEPKSIPEPVPVPKPECEFEIGWCDEHYDDNYKDYIKKKKLKKCHKILM